MSTNHTLSYRTSCALLCLCFLMLPQSTLVATESHHTHDDISITQSQLDSIAKKIYQNETGSNPNYLIAWNEGENFASLGLGHFIWFPKGLNSPFTETFPDFIEYLLVHDVAVPEWMLNNRDFPFHSKEKYTNAINSEKMLALKRLMLNTFSHQINFIFNRMQRALPLMLNENLSLAQQKHVSERFYKLANTSLGLYSLIDYVNFKGEGVSKSERYADKGWGLLQVLLNIQDDQQNINVAFSQACKYVLNRRVYNSPQREIEAKWIKGWERRCDTYR